jgi:hypothetical protein
MDGHHYSSKRKILKKQKKHWLMGILRSYLQSYLGILMVGTPNARRNYIGLTHAVT